MPRQFQNFLNCLGISGNTGFPQFPSTVLFLFSLWTPMMSFLVCSWVIGKTFSAYPMVRILNSGNNFQVSLLPKFGRGDGPFIQRLGSGMGPLHARVAAKEQSLRRSQSEQSLGRFTSSEKFPRLSLYSKLMLNVKHIMGCI